MKPLLSTIIVFVFIIMQCSNVRAETYADLTYTDVPLEEYVAEYQPAYINETSCTARSGYILTHSCYNICINSRTYLNGDWVLSDPYPDDPKYSDWLRPTLGEYLPGVKVDSKEVVDCRRSYYISSYACSVGYYGCDCLPCPENAVCPGGDCVSYECDYGYYHDMNDDYICKECPAVGTEYGVTSSTGSEGISSCYLTPLDFEYQAPEGNFILTGDCYYQE